MSKQDKLSKLTVGSGLLTALLGSLCCIAPLVALVSGVTGTATVFSFIEPFRPYIIVLTLLLLAVAWYFHFNAKAQVDCDCEDDKPSFWKSRTFLSVVTLLSIASLVFPYYANTLMAQPQASLQTNTPYNTIEVKVSGMTCTGCEIHIEQALGQVAGILSANANYENANAIVSFDPTIVSVDSIQMAINKTGYTADSTITIPNGN